MIEKQRKAGLDPSPYQNPNILANARFKVGSIDVFTILKHVYIREHCFHTSQEWDRLKTLREEAGASAEGVAVEFIQYQDKDSICKGEEVHRIRFFLKIFGGL